MKMRGAVVKNNRAGGPTITECVCAGGFTNIEARLTDGMPMVLSR